MAEFAQAIWRFFWSWTAHRVHELVAYAPLHQPVHFAVVAVTAFVVAVFYTLIGTGVI